MAMEMSASIIVPEVMLARLEHFDVLLKNKFEDSIGELMEKCHIIACGDFAQNFQSQGANMGVSWTPLKMTTVKYRMSQGYQGYSPIHVRSGALARTMTQKNAPGHEWKIKKTGKHSITATLIIMHEAGRSATVKPHRPNSSTNLVEELTHSTDPNRENRPLYDSDGYGVSEKAVSQMQAAFERFSTRVSEAVENALGK